MAKSSYKIPVSIDRSRLDHKITLQAFQLKSKPLSIKIILYWVLFVFVTAWVVLQSPLSAAPWIVLVFLVIWMTVTAAVPPPAPVSVNLRTAATFGVLAATSLTNNSGGTTFIIGDVGSPSQTTDPVVAPGFTNYKSGAILDGALADVLDLDGFRIIKDEPFGLVQERAGLLRRT